MPLIKHDPNQIITQCYARSHQRSRVRRLFFKSQRDTRDFEWQRIPPLFLTKWGQQVLRLFVISCSVVTTYVLDISRIQDAIYKIAIRFRNSPGTISAKKNGSFQPQLFSKNYTIIIGKVRLFLRLLSIVLIEVIDNSSIDALLCNWSARVSYLHDLLGRVLHLATQRILTSRYNRCAAVHPW